MIDAAQPAKTALFAGGNEGDVRKRAGAPSPQATFSNEPRLVGGLVDFAHAVDEFRQALAVALLDVGADQN
jgi:hypothetical protein